MFNIRVAGILAGELVGRADTIAVVTQAVERARRGQGECLILIGEPGVGKSRLAREMVELAHRRGLGTFIARAVSGDVPLGPLVSAFVACGRHGQFPASPELEALRPVLGHIVPDWAQPSAPPLPPERVAPLLSEAVIRLTRVLAPRGAILVIEDLHVADPETLAVLDHLSDTLASTQLGLLVTLRPGSVASDRWVAGALARRTAEALDVEPLDRREVAALVAACLGGRPPEGLVDFVTEHSDGLPLLVEDLLAGLVAAEALAEEDGEWSVVRPLEVGIPRTFAETVEQRLRALPPPAVGVLRAAAVLGRQFDWRVLPPMCGLPEVEVLDHLRAAISQLLLTSEMGGDDEFRFRHALTRDVVLAGLLPPERARLAACGAEAMVDLLHDDAALARAAMLHAESGASDRAAELLLKLGQRSFARGALDVATDALGRARAHSTDPSAHHQIERLLVEVHAASGRADAAFQIGAGLLARTSEQEAPGVHLCLARAASAAGHLERATQHLDAIPPGSSEHLRAAILRASMAVSLREPVPAEALALEALRLADDHGSAEARCEALQVLGRAVRLRSPAEAQTWFDQSRRIAVQAGLPLSEVRALLELGTVDVIETGRTDRLEAARRVARSLGTYETVGQVELHLGILLAHRDERRAAEATLRSAIDVARTLQLEGLDRIARAQLGYAHALAGRADEAEACIDDVNSAGTLDDAGRVATGLAAPFARLLREDRPNAIASVDESLHSTSDPSWPQWGLRALLYAVEGDDRPAGALESAVTATGRGRLQHAYLLFALAVGWGGAGDVDRAEGAVHAGLEQLGWQVAHRRFCLRQLGEAAARDGWGEPIAWLTEALEEFREDAAPVASACRRLIREAGGTVPRAGRGDSRVPARLRAVGVTSREMDVLKLVALGRTNEQIAKQLHLSRRTVEGHVTNLLSKTRAADRSALAHMANPVPMPH